MSASFVVWGNAWLTGHAGLDDAVDEVEAAAGPQVLAGPGGDVPLRHALAELRVEGLTEFRLALPAPGDPLGLAGPPGFTSAAVDAGQAVLAVLPGIPGRCLGLVPAEDRRGSSYVGLRWTSYDASRTLPYTPSLPEAEHALTLAMRDTADVLAGLDAATVPPSELTKLRRDDKGLAPGYPARAHRVAALTARLSLVLKLASEDRGLTAAQVAARADALRHLDHAVRRARVAACNSILESVPDARS
ncbi:hypothetical protein D5H75_39515 [Bailinhaonella thermotolerans]|uniref:Uncharacterized protein n=1 Tax=Bailinhaonella thermotolerans TaxID=1070861 RepID=A0A3A4AMQ1_9ACTN|nr:hypothetical protein D5H75_39515 [Bailinhaonella thermotolerans]